MIPVPPLPYTLSRGMLYQNLIIGLIANLVELEIVNFLESYVHLLNSVISMVMLDVYSYGEG